MGGYGHRWPTRSDDPATRAILMSAARTGTDRRGQRGNPMQLTFDSASDLARALRRAADAHAQHEEQAGRPDPDWPNWYARYLEREQAGLEHGGTFPARPDGATVPVAVVTSRTEAELIVGMLRNNGLRAAVAADDAGGQDPALQVQGVRVLVAPSDEASARRLIAAANDPPRGSAPAPPGPG